MKLTLHIGTEKTGTTALQTWFAANRGALQPRGVFYPSSLGQTTHRKLAVYARDADKPDDGFTQNKIGSPEEHEAFCVALAARFAKECEEHAHIPMCVISSEHLHSRLTTDQMVGRVKNLLRENFVSIEVIVHLRPQVDVLVSLASTATRVGLKVGHSWFSRTGPKDLYYNYDFLVRRWECVFGAEAVTVVPFKRQPSMIDVLTDRLELDTAGLSPVVRQNAALDWRTIALVNAMLAHDPEINLRILQLDEWPVREKLAVGLETAQQFQDVFEKSNAALISRRKELIEGDLTPDWSRYDAPPNLDRLEGAMPYGEHLSHVVSRLSTDLMLERCACRVLQCELALGEGNTGRACTCLREARTAMVAARKTGAKGARVDDLQQRISVLAQRSASA